MGVDETRYASISREMARSGDWVTPRLWGLPWFEQPVLLYWVQALGYRTGLGPEIAARLPVALCAVAFLVFFWWILHREFGCLQAWFATLILGTTGGYLGYSQVGHMDLLLTATFASAILLTLPWISKGDARFLPWAAALIGLAVLAKSGVALVLLLPLAWWGRRRFSDLLRPRVVLPFFAVALPWYVVCYLRNGTPFLRELFLRQQLQRLTSGALLHVQPFWYYLPVILALVLPWTPLTILLFRKPAYRDPRSAFLLGIVVWGLVFFSISPNKLPGYVLPLLPFLSTLIALSLAQVNRARVLLALCALLLVAFPIAASLLPYAVESGVSHAPRPHFQVVWLIPAAIAALAWTLDSRARRLAAVFAVAAGACVGMISVKALAGSDVDRQASARTLWHQVSPMASDTCVSGLSRNSLYSLNYYSVTPLPECALVPRRIQVRERPGGTPYLFDTKTSHTVDPAVFGSVPSLFRN